MAAKCSQRQDSPWHAAKHLEKAAEASRETQDWTLTVDYLKQAALAYREAGRPQSAAETLAKGARMLEDKNPEVLEHKSFKGTQISTIQMQTLKIDHYL